MMLQYHAYARLPVHNRGCCNSNQPRSYEGVGDVKNTDCWKRRHKAGKQGKGGGSPDYLTMLYPSGRCNNSRPISHDAGAQNLESTLSFSCTYNAVLTRDFGTIIFHFRTQMKSIKPDNGTAN